MRNKFNTKWKASKQPRKQRKYKANAPLHIKRKMLGANLSKTLRKKYGKRSIPVRKGDVVKVARGKFKKKQGKVLRVKTRDCKFYIEGIQVKKLDGSKVDVAIKPSNVQIIELNIEDRKRLKSLGKDIKKDVKKGEGVSKKNVLKKTENSK